MYVIGAQLAFLNDWFFTRAYCPVRTA